MLSIDFDKLDEAFVELGLDTMSSNEYTFLQTYYECLKPVAYALKILEGSSHTFGAYLPMLFGLRQKILALKTKMAHSECKHLVDAILNGLDTRFGHLFVLDEKDGRSVPLYIAMICNPTYKLSYMNPNSIQPSTMRKIRCMLLKAGMIESLKSIECHFIVSFFFMNIPYSFFNSHGLGRR